MNSEGGNINTNPDKRIIKSNKSKNSGYNQFGPGLQKTLKNKL